MGTLQDSCGALEKIGQLCYPKCPAGYSRKGLACQQNCPAGWTDDGLICRLVEYNRGSGYNWLFSDGLDPSKMVGRCEAENGKGKCEAIGWNAYPKCKKGFYLFDCCTICRPNAVNCTALGFSNGSDFACSKKIITGAPTNMSCSSKLRYDAGLCYKACKAGFVGVGPVCWANNPASWVGCGLGAAATTQACSDAVFDQETTLGNLALNIASAGAGNATNITNDSPQAADLKKQFEDLKKQIAAS